MPIGLHAKHLRMNPPPSEVWYETMCRKYGITLPPLMWRGKKRDRKNRHFKFRYIPDVCNHYFRYVVEIDGKEHQTPSGLKKDQIRDLYFLAEGYHVIRIKSYDEGSFLLGAVDLIKRRGEKSDVQSLTKRQREYLKQELLKVSSLSAAMLQLAPGGQCKVRSGTKTESPVLRVGATEGEGRKTGIRECSDDSVKA